MEGRQPPGPELSDQALFRFCPVLHSYNLEVRFLISINRNDPVVLEVLNHWGSERERPPEWHIGFKTVGTKREGLLSVYCSFFTSNSLQEELISSFLRVGCPGALII